MTIQTTQAAIRVNTREVTIPFFVVGTEEPALVPIFEAIEKWQKQAKK